MPKKLTGLERVLGSTSLAAVAYGEIASSLYFALGVVALYALGFTPWVLLAVGLLFLLVALSYAEGTTALPETGGAATFVRRAFNDPAGFVAGWVLFLDYLIVIALAALFAPQYLGDALGWEAISRRPWDVLAAVGLVAAIAGIRLLHRPRLYGLAVALAAVALVTHLLLVVLGLAFLVSTDALGRGLDLGQAPTWDSIAFALPLAMLAYTGLETVANLAAETRDPGRALPRGLFAGIGAVVAVSAAVGVVAMSAYPAHPDPDGPGGWSTDLGTEWLRAPLAALAAAFGGELPAAAVDALRVFVGVTATVVLAAAVTTSISGAGRLAYSLGRHDMLPHAFARLSRRTLIPPVAIVAAAAIASALLLLAVAVGNETEVRFLASLYSFGVLLAFTAAQLAVVRLRFTEPELDRPFRVPGNVRLRGADVPVAALVGAPLTFGVWIAAVATHEGAAVAGPIWLAAGMVVYILSRRAAGAPLLRAVEPAEAVLVPGTPGLWRRILVPLKFGAVGEDVLGTAIKLATEDGATVEVLHVIRVPLEQERDATMLGHEAQARHSVAEARRLAEEHGVAVRAKIVRHRDLGAAIIEEAIASGADLIVMGSSPRWRRWSLFVSPTVDKVLRRAPCEVMVVAYPERYFDEDGGSS
jgi:APA family basic amino acid/polyamine antiporter